MLHITTNKMPDWQSCEPGLISCQNRRPINGMEAELVLHCHGKLATLAANVWQHPVWNGQAVAMEAAAAAWYWSNYLLGN